jgi:Flp pilus assembly protein TadB
MIGLAALAGGLCGLGVLLIVRGVRGASAATQAPPSRTSRPDLLHGADRRLLAAAAAAGIVVWVVTGWPVAGVAATVGTLGVPWLTGGRRRARRRLDRLAALADWTRRLADVLVAGAGLEQAIDAGVRSAPAPISNEVARLAARLRARQPIRLALQAFAGDLADPTGDLVVAALLLAADRRGRGLANVLTGLAAAVEAEVSMRRTVDAERATPRTTARYLTGVTVITVIGLVVLRRSYMSPFGTLTGQLVLALVAVIFAAGFGWMALLTRDQPGQRFLPTTQPGPLTRGRT